MKRRILAILFAMMSIAGFSQPGSSSNSKNDFISITITDLIGALIAIAALGKTFYDDNKNKKERANQRKYLETQIKIAKEKILTSESQTEATIILRCLEIYLELCKNKTKAILEKNERLAEQYWQGLIDLHWTEYKLWEHEYIRDDVIAAWCYARNKDLDDDHAIRIETDTNDPKLVKYSDVYNGLLSTGYYPYEDLFIDFMKRIHDLKNPTLNNILNILRQMRQELNKRRIKTKP